MSSRASRDENGNFPLFQRKMETERKYENGNENLQNGNGNGIFYAETETKTERCFPVEHAWKWNFRFREYGISVFTIDL